MAWLGLKAQYYEAVRNVKEPQRPAPMDLPAVEKVRKAAAASAFDQETRDVFQHYMKRTLLQELPDLSSTVTADICDECGVQMLVIANDSMLACGRCAKTRIITSANAWSASMDVDFSAMNNHQKSRVFEWLETIQAKEYGDIPEDTLQSTMQALIAAKATGLEPHIKAITEERALNGPYLDAPSAIERLKPVVPNIEGLLRDLDAIAVRNVIKNSSSAKKYSERAAKVAALLSGYWPERLTADQEEYVRKLFMAASPAYDKWRRTSQPIWPGGYAYFLRCLMILLGWDEFAAMFPIQMTGRNQEREDMRAAIWATLQWANVPSTGPLSPVLLPDGSVMDGSLVAAADQRCKFTARGYDEL
jgi:hypothetical protein